MCAPGGEIQNEGLMSRLSGFCNNALPNIVAEEGALEVNVAGGLGGKFAGKF